MSRARWRGRRRVAALALAALALGAGLAACGAHTTAAVSTGSAASSQARTGALTLIDGKTATLAAFAGRPVLAWFVEDGCASCAASIPVVAKHLGAFARAHTRVLVLGMYGEFGQGPAGRSQLVAFGRSAAGSAINDRGWTWGVASAALTVAYDPGGIPDEYFLLDRAGRIVYQGSGPVSTIGALLTHLKAVAS